jgi:hypothetical protein
MHNYRLKHLQHAQIQIEIPVARCTADLNTYSMLNYRLKHLQHTLLQTETYTMLSYKLKQQCILVAHIQQQF